MTNILIIILLSLLLFTSSLFGQSSESGVLYLWETSSDLEWKTFGNNDLQPRYKRVRSKMGNLLEPGR